MSGKRDRLEIINDVLALIRDRQGKIRPTHVMYKANLSHEMLTGYMSELLAKGFITESKSKDGKKTYFLTEKGFGFLKDYSMIKGFVDSYDLKD